jgi:hypothetical protein
LLSAGLAGSARHAYAQDAGATDPEEGSWSADIGNPPDANPEANAVNPPINVQGCWNGFVHDRLEGKGTLSLGLEQNGTVLEPNFGGFKVFWNAQNRAQGPIVKGSVSSSGIKFKGTATSKCTILATGKGNATKIRGTYTFRKECAIAFKGGTFTVTPGGPCP